MKRVDIGEIFFYIIFLGFLFASGYFLGCEITEKKHTKHEISYFRAVKRYNDAISCYASASWGLTIDEASLTEFMKTHSNH